MRAVGYRQSLPISADESLLDLELPAPEPGPRDLLVRVQAVSVNPVDTKQRMRAAPMRQEAGVAEAQPQQVRRRARDRIRSPLVAGRRERDRRRLAVGPKQAPIDETGVRLAAEQPSRARHLKSETVAGALCFLKSAG